MNNQMEIIAHIQTDFPSKFGVPRQSGLADALQAKIIFEPEYRNPDCVRGLEDFSHIWLLWSFSETKQREFSPTVRPPRLGGNRHMGVFATRSPFRPNGIALSCVRLEKIEFTSKNEPVLLVRGADMVSGTPIYDIKPYLPFTDSHPDAVAGFADAVRDYELRVEFPEGLLCAVPPEIREGLVQVLRQDPRPSYQNDPERVYGFGFAGFEVKFTVDGEALTVCDVIKE